SAPLLPRTAGAPQLPERSVHLAVATAWPSTPGEIVLGQDVIGLARLVEAYLRSEAETADKGQAKKPAETLSPEALLTQLKEIRHGLGLPEPSTPKRPTIAPSPEAILKQLIETYGVSGGHEGNVTRAIAQLLPPWAKTETDEAGNLWLRWPGSSTSNAPTILVVAHQDEIGYEVHAILPDGRLELESKGGGVLAYFLGHAALVHSAN